jgi:hypothetical protein
MVDKRKNNSSIGKPSVKKTNFARQSGEKLPSEENFAESGSTGGGFARSLAGDRSLQSFKNWINGMAFSINPNLKDTVTEEQWVEHWKKFWAGVDSASAARKKNGKISEDSSKPRKILTWEERHPGVTEQLRRFEEAVLPSCPHCGSEDTASVQVGIIGRTMELAASTRKFKLVPNMVNKLGKYFCNECENFFD